MAFSFAHWKSRFFPPHCPLPPEWLEVVTRLEPDVLVWEWADAAESVQAARRVVLGVVRARLGGLQPQDKPLTQPPLVWRQWLERKFAKLGPLALAHLEAVWDCSVEQAVVEHYVHERGLREKHPEALLPNGRAEFAKWLLKQGARKFSWAPVDLLWFLQAAAEQEARWEPLTLSLTPAAQAHRPDYASPSVAAGVNGVNVLGHFTIRSGLQQSALRTVAGLRSVGYDVALRNIPVCTGRDSSIAGEAYLSPERYPASILHLTPDPFYDDTFARAGLWPRPGIPRVGLYAWELPNLPAAWDVRPPWLSEIWVYTHFVGQSFRHWGLPVQRIFPGISVPPLTGRARARFGLPADRFLFLFMFDLSSTLERKNPAALLAAWQQAMRPDDNARLVLKVSRAREFPEAWATVQTAAAACNALVITEMLTDQEIWELEAACDAYVSLHRAEGFGFTLAETMLLGKPVIATDYSGNAEYLHAGNSFPVQYKLAPVPPGCGNYPEGSTWAAPDVSHAVHLLRQVLTDRPEASARALVAQREAREWFDPVRSGQAMANRLEALLAAAHATLSPAGK